MKAASWFGSHVAGCFAINDSSIVAMWIDVDLCGLMWICVDLCGLNNTLLLDNNTLLLDNNTFC